MRFSEQHGLSKTLAYSSWAMMKKRCLNPNSTGYGNYGGRGIKICDRWLNSFSNFYEDMGDRLVGQSLDRLDNDGDYTPSNCIWNDAQGQAENRRTTLLRHRY